MTSQDIASKLGLRPGSLRSLAYRLGFAAVSGLGGFIVTFLLAQATASLHTLLLIARFGASCVLVFALPQAPLAQPPPAGADPIVVILAKAGWTFLLSRVLAGTVLIVAIAFAYHRLFSLRPYPI